MQPTQRQWKWIAAPAILGITAGLTLITSGGDVVAIGGVLAGFTTLALCMSLIRKWILDTNDIRREFRAAIRACDAAREENQLATAITMGERERARSETATAKAEARQAQINYDQRARAAERHKEEEVAEAERILQQEFEEKRAQWFKESYVAGIVDALSGRIDTLVLDAPDADVIEFIDAREQRRPTGTDRRG
jgi:hypothetical protein